MVRTNVEIDDKLRRVVKLYQQRQAGRDLAGIGWEGDLDAMQRDLTNDPSA
jgi:Arc/MetJ family transcription regulator